jgi:hypothetical protein
MSKTTAIFASITAVAALGFLTANAQSQVLYQDTTTFLGDNLNFGEAEVGNEISLDGTSATYLITSFIYQFDFVSDSGSGVPNGNEMGDFRLYENNGPAWKPGHASPATIANAPGTLIYDSGPFQIGGFTSSSGARVEFSNPADFGAAVIVPRRFTWTMSYSGLTANETAGLAIYSPATVGTNFGEAWINYGSNWQLLAPTPGNPALVFGAIASGTPMPELQVSAQSNLLVLSWPTNVIGFSVVSTTNLSAPANWLPVSGATVIDNQNVVTDTISSDAKFYQLTLPLSL